MAKQKDSLNSNGTTIDSKVQKLAQEYLRIEKNSEYIEEINRLIQEQDVEQLERILSNRLTFGTAGIRGQMGPGFNRMNDLVVIQTGQGISSYLLETNAPETCKSRGIIIGHDARHNSARFSQLLALSFLQKGIKVYHSDHIVPTPLVAFGVVRYGCQAGLMVTASHNPKDDNGIKVFWSNGAQIQSPTDILIQDSIVRPENLEPWPRAWDYEALKTEKRPKEWSDLLVNYYEDLTSQYYSFLEALVGSEAQKNLNRSSDLRITYTPIHGVGDVFMNKALQIGGFKDIFAVEAQRHPDPDFRTVKFPNPEEPGALDLAFETAIQTNSNLILANDPDSDRCAVAIIDRVADRRRILNGNEVGALLGWWLWHLIMNENSNEGCTKTVVVDPTEYCMISSAVSSRFLESMARVEGFQFHETLTGFKYLGNFAEHLMKNEGKRVIFAYEESLGYMVSPKILDKDGISATLQVAQCAAYLKSSLGRSLDEQLDWLHERYGYHYSSNSYFICKDQGVIRKIFTDIQSNYPDSFAGERIVRIRDLNNGLDTGTEDKKPKLPSSSSYFMVTFFLEGGISIVFRTSGTEPKVKYYSEIVAQLTKGAGTEKHKAEKSEAQKRLSEIVEAAIERCLRPHELKLERCNA